MRKETGIQAAFECSAAIFMAFVCAISLLAGTGWLFNRPILASLRPDYIPMAPANVLIFLGMCGVWLIQRIFPARRGMRILVQAVLLGMLLIVIMLALRYFTGLGPDLEKLLYPAPPLFGLFTSARMSPLSALGFFLAILAFLLMTGSRPDTRAKSVSAALSLALFILSGIIILGYLYGAPPFYGGMLIPVALTTALSFWFFSLGLLMTAGPASWPAKDFTGPSLKARLLRSFIPASILVILMEGFLSTAFAPLILNPAVRVAVSVFVVVLIVILITFLIARNLSAEFERGKQAEQAQKQSEFLFRSLFEASPDSVMLIDPNDPNISWPIIDCNAVACLMNGYGREEMIGHSIDIVNITPGSPAERIVYLKQLREVGSLKLETFHRHKNGTIFPIEVSTTLIKFGERELVMGIDRDITARKQAEEALTSSEAELRALFASMHDVVVVIDHLGVYLMIAPTNPELLVKPSEELLGKTLRDVFPHEEAETFIKVVQQVLDTKQTAQIEYDLTIGERTVQFETSISPMTADSTLWVARDITERKRAEAALTEQRNLLRTLLDNLPDHIYFKDRLSRFTHISESQARLFGLRDPAEAVGKTDFDFFSEEHARPAFEIEQNIIKTGQPVIDLEEKETWPDGRVNWVNTTKMPILDQAGNIIGTFGISSDITERKRSQAELQASREAERKFGERLTTLSETTTELSKADSLDVLCRRAVELGRERLDFDRLSIWFVTEDRTAILGTYGVDAEGRITDERGDRYPIGPESNIRSILQNQIPLLRLTDSPLALKGHEVGQGTHVFAGLWDGTTATGYISVDNLLRQRPIGDRDCEIIRLYAIALGHLISLKRTETELRLSEERFSKSFQSNPIATIIEVLPDGRLLDVNEIFLRLTGYNREEVIGKTSLGLNLWVNPEDRIRFTRGLIEQQSLRDVECQLLKKSGEKLYVLASAEIIEIAGQPHGLIMLSDITGRKRNDLIQNAIYRITQAGITSEGIDQFYHSIHSILGELIPVENFFIALIEPVSKLISFPYYIDQYDEPPVGMTPLQGLTGYIIRTGRPLLATREDIEHLVQQGQVERLGSMSVDWMGAPLKVEGRMIGVMAVQSYTDGIHFNQEDLNLLEIVSTQVAQAIERKRMEEEIRNLSLTDALTGLYNRRGFTLLAEQEMKLAHRIKRSMLLFFGDVDNLKMINDTHGHAQGDQALNDISAILKETFREADIVARIGGDEFVVLAVDASMERADSLTNRIQSILEKHNQPGDRPYQLSFSLGIAHYDPETPCTLNDLIAQADGRMYQEKQARKGKK